MKMKEVERAFSKLLDTKGAKESPITPEKGLGAMAEFYHGQRVKDCDLENDGDMLLFEWGTYDFEGLEEFSLSITRQLIAEDEEEPFQLTLRFYYPCDQSTQEAGDGELWCDNLEGLDKFLTEVQGTEGYGLKGLEVPHRMELTFEEC